MEDNIETEPERTIIDDLGLIGRRVLEILIILFLVCLAFWSFSMTHREPSANSVNPYGTPKNYVVGIGECMDGYLFNYTMPDGSILEYCKRPNYVNDTEYERNLNAGRWQEAYNLARFCEAYWWVEKCQ